MLNQTYYTTFEVDALQKEALDNPPERDPWEMVSYRCSGCLSLVSSTTHFCRYCENRIKSGHSQECCGRNKQCTCAVENSNLSLAINHFKWKVIRLWRRLTGLFKKKHYRTFRPGLIKCETMGIQPMTAPNSQVLTIRPVYK